MRPSLAEIGNQALLIERQRFSRTYGGYIGCTAYLFKKEALLERIHKQ